MWLCRRSESTEHNSAVINMQLIKFINSLKIFEKDIPWCYNLQNDAKKLYTNCTAAVLRAKSCVMKTATSVQENAGDILAEAKQINEDRVAEAEAEVVDDFCETEETAEE